MNEDEGVVVLRARVLSGSLSSPVVVRVTTDEGTARGIIYYTAYIE